MRRIAYSLAALLALAGCARQAQDEPAEAPDTMAAVAAAAYDPTMFDSISWESQEAALERGKMVYNYSCEKCHGTEGAGDAGFIRQGDTLRPPSFRDPAWRFAQDKEGLRQQVFVGNTVGMPHWGLEGLKPRDVDAVAIYIIETMQSN